MLHNAEFHNLVNVSCYANLFFTVSIKENYYRICGS